MNNTASRRQLLILGIILVSIGILGLVPLYFFDVPEHNRDILIMGLAQVLGWGGMAVTYYYTTDKNR